MPSEQPRKRNVKKKKKEIKGRKKVRDWIDFFSSAGLVGSTWPVAGQYSIKGSAGVGEIHSTCTSNQQSSIDFSTRTKRCCACVVDTQDVDSGNLARCVPHTHTHTHSFTIPIDNFNRGKIFPPSRQFFFASLDLRISSRSRQRRHRIFVRDSTVDFDRAD